MAASLTLTRWGMRRHSDGDVFALALGGNPVAFSEVYRRYQKPIYGYCLARLMEPEAAADATQEVFMRFLDSPRDGIENPRAWLYTVARNVTIDAIRKRARTPLPTEGEAIEAAVGPSTTDAADEFLGQEDARNVFVALRRLRPRYRTALILRELHHQSSSDMADALDTTPGAVDTLVSRARDAFGRTYGEVAELPTECRDAVAAIYKRTGTGLDDAEESRLQTHLVACTSCKAEEKRAGRLDRLSALLPFLIPAKKAGHNLFERATAALQTSPDLAARLGYALPPDRVAPAVKVAAGLLAATLIAAPIVGTVTTKHNAAPPRPSTVVASTQRWDNGGMGWSSQGSQGPHGSTWWQQGDSWQKYGSSQYGSSWSQMSGSSSWMGSSSWGMGASQPSSSKSSSWSSGMTKKKRSSSSSSKHRSSSSPRSSGSWSSGSGSGSSDGGSWSGMSGSSGSGDSMSGGSW